jgi:Helix-turn-helix domain
MTGLTLTSHEAAERLRHSLGADIKEPRVRGWCRAGKIPSAKRIGRTWHIPVRELEDIETVAYRFSAGADGAFLGSLLPARDSLAWLAKVDEGEDA